MVERQAARVKINDVGTIVSSIAPSHLHYKNGLHAANL